MPKAKPISLYPLTFDEALQRLLSAPPSSTLREIRGTGKPRKGKKKARIKK